MQPASFSIPTSDNYDIVDMDLDEDPFHNVIEVNESLNFVPKIQDLFVIDTKPSVPIDQKEASLTEANPHSASSCEVDDFEETLLRAQLILSLNKSSKHKAKLTSKINSELASDFSVINEKAVVSEEVPLPPPTTTTTTATLLSDPINLFRGPDQFASSPVAVKDSSNSKLNLNGTCVRTNKVYMPQKRIVINLTGESTSDESDEEENVNANAAFASLEALISDARQKSDVVVVAAEAVNAPVAVSCLSKAQQREYNELKKIIAQKESFQMQQKVIHSSSDDLKMLEKKLILALSTVQKEKKLMNIMKTEVAKKRSSYITSQLAVQRLKEQQLAAERLKKTNVQMLSKATSQLQTVQNSVAKRQTLICDLRRECSKLGVSVCGSNYIPPSVTFPSTNRTPKLIRKVSLTSAN